MQFDLFHSIGRIDSLQVKTKDSQVFRSFFDQTCLAEQLGFGTVWVAESHFSSEVQKKNPNPVIPEYQGEVGLNGDSFQLAQNIFSKTKRIGFGTAIHNIVGGSGGPIASADRVRTLAFLNSMQDHPRSLNIGVAAGRFPYINRPFGILPRDEMEQQLWPQVQRLIFIEALEIFLRLLNGEVLSSSMIQQWNLTRSFFRRDEDFQKALDQFADSDGLISYRPRWSFEPLKLVPDLEPQNWLKVVLGSHDPLARDHGLKFADLDLFNLSFTPPDQLNKIHEEMTVRYQSLNRVWGRGRMPRTVLVFIDQQSKRAWELAHSCFDCYREAMKGTVLLPPKEELMARALIGDPHEIREQMAPGGSRGVDSEDRLMLWFEFNQNDYESINQQMILFSEQVIPFVDGIS